VPPRSAARQGKWTNRPKFGYDLIGGELVQNSDAPTVQRIFDLRAQGLSYTRIEELTAVKYSTARAVAHFRICLGEDDRMSKTMTTELMMSIRDFRIRRDQAG
jgi:hypothetical protein